MISDDPNFREEVREGLAIRHRMIDEKTPIGWLWAWLLCKLFGHVWVWKPGIRPFCGECLRYITPAEFIRLVREEEKH